MNTFALPRSRSRTWTGLGVAGLALALTAVGAVPADAADAVDAPADDLVEVVSASFPAMDPTRVQSALRPATSSRTPAPRHLRSSRPRPTPGKRSSRSAVSSPTSTS